MSRAILVTLALATLCMASGCSDKQPLKQVLMNGPGGGDAGVASTASTADAGLPPSTILKVDYAESDFVDSESNRDPFRSYANLFDDSKTTRTTKTQHNVMLSQYGVDELKLTAIVTGSDYPRAMLVDPTGKGWVVKRGDFLGRAESVHIGGSNGVDYQLNWRVDRVRAGDVVLVREDPAQPNVPPSTRVIPLHPEGDPGAKFQPN